MKGGFVFAVSVFVMLSPFGHGIASTIDIQLAEATGPPGPMSGIVAISGDWNIIGHEAYSNATIYLTGNLTVESTGHLEFVNTTLAMNLSATGQFNIAVEGAFTMADLDLDPSTQDDASRIMSNNTAYKYTMTAQPGSDIDFRNSVIMHCGYSGLYPGLSVLTTTAAFDGMTFQNNYYGITLRGNGIVVRNSTFAGNIYGLYANSCTPVLNNLAITGSSSRGIFLYYSSPVIENCSLENNKIGIYVQNSAPTVSSCSVTGSDTAGVYSTNASPLIEDCSLSNALDMDVRFNSFPRLLNTQLNESKVMIDRGLFVSLGRRIEVSVVNGTGIPQPDVMVAVLDDQGNPASGGVTDGTGMAPDMALREKLLTREGPVEMHQHSVLAFALRGGDVLHGENISSLANASLCEVMIETNPAGVEIWPSGQTIAGAWRFENTRIIALGNVNINGGSLELENSELMEYSSAARTLSVASSGNLRLNASRISSIGTSKVLEPARIMIDTDSSSPVHMLESSLRWTSEFVVRSGETTIQELEIIHASLNGLRVISCSPFIDGLSVDWAPVGLYLSGDNSKLSGVSIERARTYGIQASQSAAAFSGVRVNNSARGLYSHTGMLNIADVNITNCDYGIYSIYSPLELTSVGVHGSSMSGIHAIDSSLDIFTGHISNSATGLHIQNTGMLGDYLSVDNNGVGLRVVGSAPVVLNSTFDNAIDAETDRGSSASLVNCSVDRARTSVKPSSHIDIGNWFDVRVMDWEFQPVPGCNVSVLDPEGRVSGSGMTGGDGHARNMVFRQSRTLWNRTLEYDSHKILAFRHYNGSLQGSAVMELHPNDVVDVPVTSGGLAWIEWTAQRNIFSREDYSGSTILAHGNVIIESGGYLALQNTTLWFFGNPESDTVLEVKSGGVFNMSGGKLSPLSAMAPMQPSRASVSYQSKSAGELTGARVHGISQVTTYSGNLRVEGSSFAEMSGTGLYVHSSSPSVTNATFYRCSDGMRVHSGYPALSNVSFAECRNNGFYATGGAPALDGVSSFNNLIGFQLVNGADGQVSDCLAEGNGNGFYMNAASPSITDSLAINNTNAGFYCQGSHPFMESVAASGNIYGSYLHTSWPIIYDSAFSGNRDGVYATQSAPYLSRCSLDGNDVGFNAAGDASGITAGKWSSGKEEEHATFVDGGVRDHISVTLPSRAVVREASISIRGAGMGADAVIEDPYRQFYPDIYGNWVVWQDYRNEAWNIHAYDLSMDSDGNGVPNYLETPALADDPALVKITDSPFTQVNPAIHGDTVVWTDYRNGNADIYAYTFSNDTEWVVCDHPGTQLKPAIHGDRIAWQDSRNGKYDIYMLNITSGGEHKLSDSPNDDRGVKIHGDYVVWYNSYGSPSGDFSDIILFDLGTWELRNINDDKPIQYDPDVHGNTVAWHDDRNGNWEIYMYEADTGDIERLTFDDPEGQRNFMPRIYGDKVVYYSANHGTTPSSWSVRMLNITTGEMGILEGEVYGDSHPVIHGNRVAWVNRSGNMDDIHVLDFSLSGYPSDVRLDINKDGSAEFFHPGEFNGREHMNGTWLAEVFNKNLGRIDGGSKAIPMSLTANGTGRVILGPVTVTYDMPTYVVDTNISNSRVSGARCSGSSPAFVNSSFASNALDFSMNSGSGPRTLNTTFSDSKLQFQDKLSNLTVQNYLHVRVQNLTGDPLDASVAVTDNEVIVLDTFTGPAGEIEWTVLTDRTHNHTGRHENVTQVTVSLNAFTFSNNPRGVNMSASHWEIFTADTVGPRASGMHPPPGWTTPSTCPGISVIVTDNQEVDLSTVRLYVQSFSVFYEHSGVPGGYNISYQHPTDFPNGTVVVCRIYARDFDGNVLDYTWEFKIDTRATMFYVELHAGWNLVSIPLETKGTGIEEVLSSISGKWDVAKWHDGQTKRWKTFRVGSSVNTFFHIDNTMGFWLRAAEACNLTVSGIEPDSTEIILYAGWNLVGYPSQAGQNAADAFWGTGADRVEVYQEETPYIREVGPNHIMNPGEGYWVRVASDAAWVVDW